MKNFYFTMVYCILDVLLNVLVSIWSVGTIEGSYDSKFLRTN